MTFTPYSSKSRTAAVADVAESTGNTRFSMTSAAARFDRRCSAVVRPEPAPPRPAPARVEAGDQLVIADRSDHAAPPVDHEHFLDSRVHHDLDDPANRRIRGDRRDLVPHQLADEEHGSQ